MQDVIERLLAEYDPRINPYFTALERTHTRGDSDDGSEDGFDKDDFLETQIQFYYAVVFFSRPMAVLAAKIPSAELRTEVLRNVWEEHGEADPSHRHGATFLELLHRLGGIEKRDVESRVLWPELRAFNTTLIGCCTLDDWEVGAALLGIIERQFADISAILGRNIVRLGWIQEDRLIHYKLHAELDIKHSQDFFDVLAPAWHDSTIAAYKIEQGFRLGAHVFDRLYRDLYHARRRRELSTTHRAQPHIYAE
ncbi:MAG: iron-containing redox enzyme family protein [Planctomycetes bacterium]|nr:iron-containing redox enzyme family protein [Planctomycetota bacterium]